MQDFIIKHEDWQHDSWMNFLRNHYRGPLPPLTEKANSVNARIEHGRWLVDCPCGSAYVPSQAEPYLICIECANQDNDGKWIDIIFPANKEAIEATLLKRPIIVKRYRQTNSPMFAENRNWTPGETIDQLRQENLEHGLEI
jgi:hypothetical protein